MKLLPTGLALASLVVPHFGCFSSGSADTASSTSSERFEIEVKLITGETLACERALCRADVGARVVTAAEAKQLLEAASSTCGIVSRPLISVSAGSTATIQTITKTDYVQDFDADARPIMGTIEHGARIVATPKSTADARSELALSIEVSGLHMPIRREDLTLPGSAKTVTVQLPELETQKIRTSVVLGEDDTAILPIGSTPGGDPVRAVVLRVHRRP